MEKITTKERIRYILLIIFCIGILSIILSMRIDSLSKIDNVSVDIIPDDVLEVKMPYDIEATGEDTFETEEKDLKISFPNNWMKDSGQTILDSMKGSSDSEGEMIFLVYKISGTSGGFSFLTVEETEKTDMDYIKNNFLGIIDDAEESEEENISEEETFRNVQIIEEMEDSLFLEVSSKEKEGTIVHSYQKLFIGENKSYIVSLITFEDSWESEKDSFQEIINSIVFEK